MHDWLEVGPGAFYRRYEPWDVNVGVVIGHDGLLVVDTRASHRQADELCRHIRRLSDHPVRWVVTTHAHFDHTYGNARFQGAHRWGHASVPADMWRGSEEVPEEAEYSEVVIAPPDHLVRDTAVLDLGGRVVELRHLGRGHTAGDLVVIVPEAELLFAGDLVEQSGPPAYGDDSFPLEWPETVARLLELVAPRGRVVPGHGIAVEKSFLAEQRLQLEVVAETIRDLWSAGVPAPEALAAAGHRWPWPSSFLAHAVARGYRQLSLSAGGDTAG